MTHIKAMFEKIAITFEEYKKLHPKTKKHPNDPLFTKGKQQKRPLPEHGTPQQSGSSQPEQDSKQLSLPFNELSDHKQMSLFDHKPTKEKFHQEEKETVKDSPKETSAPKNQEEVPPSPTAPAPLTAENERVQAEESTKKQLADKSEYAFARDSAFSNLGKDITGSARHVRNHWKNLEQAEADGTAEAQVTRDNLFKNEPPNVLALANESNLLTAIAMHGALKRFPAVPGVPKYVFRAESDSSGLTRASNVKDDEMVKYKGESITYAELKKAFRKDYYDAYKMIVTHAEKQVSENVPPHQAIQTTRALVKHLYELNSKAQRYSPITDGMRLFHNGPLDPSALGPYSSRSKRMIERGSPSRNAAMDVAYFITHSQKQYGENAETHDKSKLLEHAKDFIEGESLNKIFGVESSKKKRYTAADAYVTHAERKGPDTGLNDKAAQEDFLIKKAGLSGMQWGNSVTDDERSHHLKMAAESLKDLSEILGLPEEVISFHGNLGLAIGARGKGNALAHYEPTLKVINLTRKKGVGSLAHEWGHFFDNLIGKAIHTHGSYARPAQPMLSELSEYKRVPEHEEQGTKDVHDAMKELVTKMKEGFTKRLKNEEIFKGMMGSDKNYWSSTVEVFARCFERYVQQKLRKAGRDNTYLSGVRSHVLWPNDEEIEEMMPLFDKFFEAFNKSSHVKKKVAFLAKVAFLEARLRKADINPKEQYQKYKMLHPHTHKNVSDFYPDTSKKEEDKPVQDKKEVKIKSPNFKEVREVYKGKETSKDQKK